MGPEFSGLRPDWTPLAPAPPACGRQLLGLRSLRKGIGQVHGASRSRTCRSAQWPGGAHRSALPLPAQLPKNLVSDSQHMGKPLRSKLVCNIHLLTTFSATLGSSRAFRPTAKEAGSERGRDPASRHLNGRRKQVSAAKAQLRCPGSGVAGGENPGRAGDGPEAVGDAGGAPGDPTNRAHLTLSGVQPAGPAARGDATGKEGVAPRLWVKMGIWPQLSVARLVPAPALPLTQAQIWADGMSASSLIYSHRNTDMHYAYGPGICRSILIGIFIKLQTSDLVF